MWNLLYTCDILINFFLSEKRIESFHKAFGITDGAMYLTEQERIIIW